MDNMTVDIWLIFASLLASAFVSPSPYSSVNNRGLWASGPRENPRSISSPKGTSKRCWSVDKWKRSTDQWCIDNCLHIPPYCPKDFCKCEGTTEEATTIEGTTDEATTMEGKTEEATTMEGTIEEATTMKGKTEEATTVEGTTEEATTMKGKTEEATTMESTTEEATTMEGTTEEATTMESTTEEATTMEGTTEKATTMEDKTEEATTMKGTTKKATTTTEESTMTTEDATTTIEEATTITEEATTTEEVKTATEERTTTTEEGTTTTEEGTTTTEDTITTIEEATTATEEATTTTDERTTTIEEGTTTTMEGTTTTTVGPTTTTEPTTTTTTEVETGGWSSWSSWSACSQTCGNATKSRTRRCSNQQPSIGWQQCPGPAEQTTTCSLRSCSSEYSCYADDTTPYRRFGARTSYLINANLDDTEISVAGCEPAMLWLNARHGSRGPHRSEIARMNQILPGLKRAILQAFREGKSKLCHKDVCNLKNWRSIYSPCEDRLLGDAGRKEMRELGQRMAKRFPNLLKDSKKTVRKTSPEQRTNDSMKALLMGLFGDHEPVDFEDITDDMFTYNEKCSAYVNGVERNSKIFAEVNKLKKRPEYHRMLEGISDRIGVQLNEEQLDIAWIVCRHEIANFPDEVSPWCAIFSESELRLLEYADNLLYYYKDGYGFNITWQMTQPLMADLSQKLSSLKTEVEMTPAVLYVVHSGIAHTMLTALGLYRDEEPPLASDWPTPHTKWTTSSILSFGHNLAVVGLKCEDPRSPLQVLVMHQERRISLAHICGQEICPLQSFLDNIQPIVAIDFDEVCQYKNH